MISLVTFYISEFDKIVHVFRLYALTNCGVAYLEALRAVVTWSAGTRSRRASEWSRYDFVQNVFTISE